VRRSSAVDVPSVDADVTKVDVELDAPDDVVLVDRRSSREIIVDLADDRATLSDASLDRLAAAARAPVHQPSPAPSVTDAVQWSATAPYVEPPVCDAPCAVDDVCPVAMSCDVAAPEAQCARSLERLGVACPPCAGVRRSPCVVDEDVCPAAAMLDAAAQCSAVSMTSQTCQTEPPPPPRSGTASAGSRSSGDAAAGSMVTGTETESNLDELYSANETDEVAAEVS